MAAGLGFKTFTTGEVLTAADTNGYLMQGVLVFASSAARASAITAPQEGQYSYLKDTNSTEYYDGAAWIAAPIGDITGVTAGTGISGGGTSGTVTITNSMATEITAKGDLIAGTGSATFDNLPVGTNGQVLTADSTVSPTGLKWATPATASSGLTFISRTSFSNVASQAFDGVFTSTYRSYLITIDSLYAATSTDDLQLQYRYAGPTTQTTGYYGTAVQASYNSATVASSSTNGGTSQLLCDDTGRGTSGPSAGYFYASLVGNASEVPAINGQYFVTEVGKSSYFSGGPSTARIYTGFLLKSSSTNITGIVTIYGLAGA